MSDAVLIAIIAAGPPTCVALVGLLIGWWNHKQGKEIHVLVNSNLSAVKSDLNIANQRITALQDLIVAMGKPPVAVTVPSDLMVPPK